jgi:hypothetical protein
LKPLKNLFFSPYTNNQLLKNEGIHPEMELHPSISHPSSILLHSLPTHFL